jgi:hypothetical protein
MKRMFLAAAALSTLAACTDPYGRVDPARSALLGAGIGAAGGAVIGGIAQSNQKPPHYGYGYGRGYGYVPPPQRYHGHGGYGGGYSPYGYGSGGIGGLLPRLGW